MKLNKNLKVYGVIYKITNKVNGKVYIGQTIQGFNRRYHCNIENNTHNSYLKRSIKKYGIDNFDICEVFDIAFSKDELNIKEWLWIKYYDSTNRNKGYNRMTGGGSLGKHSEESKEKNRQSHIGIHQTEESKNKISNTLKGKTRPIEVREKISKGLTGKNNGMYGRTGKNNPHYRKIICITTGKDFDCLREAGEFYGIKSTSHITSCCAGKRKSCGMYNGQKLQWMYYEDYLNLNTTNKAS